MEFLIPKIKSNSVGVNCHTMPDVARSFGGYKHSGFGRDLSRASLDGYLDSKPVMIAI